MSTKIRLKRAGRKKSPFYRIVVIDSREKRDGRCIEDLGWFDPLKDLVSIKLNRFDHWFKVGAIPSERVNSIAKKQKEVAPKTDK
jgi:small subunit ribosomal protein S16